MKTGRRTRRAASGHHNYPKWRRSPISHAVHFKKKTYVRKAHTRYIGPPPSNASASRRVLKFGRRKAQAQAQVFEGKPPISRMNRNAARLKFKKFMRNAQMVTRN